MTVASLEADLANAQDEYRQAYDKLAELYDRFDTEDRSPRPDEEREMRKLQRRCDAARAKVDRLECEHRQIKDKLGEAGCRRCRRARSPTVGGAPTCA